MMTRRAQLIALAAAVLLAAYLAWTVQGWRMGEALAEERRRHAVTRTVHAAAAETAQRRERDEEKRRFAAMETLRHEADLALAAAVQRERDAGAVRLREALADYTARHRARSSPAPAQPGAPAGDPIGLLAVVLGDLDDMAGLYAAQADRARIAGLTCERAYDALTAGKVATP
ncbi:Homology to phage-tail assembly proteins [plant metagenome]|uniref:Homology to phage-tail assembly proteins n=1 Tax=plant metagenome TaxID=1297885 RepID=A0A484S6Z5_9ZZZZ